MPAKKEMPSTLQRSDRHAQEIWAKAHDSAVGTYGEGQRAHRTAYAALKHEYQKVGDHWERKSGGRKGPSDRQASRGASSRRQGRTAGGVDANASKQELYEQAKRLDVKGRSSMSKGELVGALQKASGRETAKRRSK